MNTAFTESNAQANTAFEMAGQYSLAKILGIWALATLPMGILSWVVFPALSPDYNSDPLGAGVTRFVLLTLGLIWLFVLSMIMVRQEEGDLRWATIKRRLRLNTPCDVRTGEPRRRLWLWIIPFMIASIVWEMGFVPYVDGLWVTIFPFFAEPPAYGFGCVLQSQEILTEFHKKKYSYSGESGQERTGKQFFSSLRRKISICRSYRVHVRARRTEAYIAPKVTH